MYVDAGQIAVDADIAAMAHHHHHRTAKAEHCTDLTVKDAASLSARAALNINALIVERYVMQAFHIILAKVADDTIAASNGNRQPTAIALKAATNTHVFCRTVQQGLSLLTGCCHLLGMFASLRIGTLLGSQTGLLSFTGLTLSSLTSLLVLGSHRLTHIRWNIE